MRTLIESVTDALRATTAGESRDREEADMATAGRLTAVGALIGSLEELSRREDGEARSLFSWPVRQTALRAFRRRSLAPLWSLIEPRRYRLLLAGRALCAAGVLMLPDSSRARGPALLGLAASGLLRSYRNSYGSDGSDQLSFITFTSLATAHLPGLTAGQRAVPLHFVGFQSVLSYTVAGVAKLLSPQWRSGSAIEGIFRTRTYGDAGFYRMLKERPGAARALAWTVILTETTTPVVLLLPPAGRRAVLGMAGLFHLGNARYMGLNRFFWAFTGTYPLVDRSARAVRWQIGIVEGSR